MSDQAYILNKALPDPRYSGSRVYIYGVPIIRLPGPEGSEFQITMIYPHDGDWELALVHGYAYEGHCYKFDAPKILLVQRGRRSVASGCGYDGSYLRADPQFPNVPVVARYSMWIVDKLEQTLQMELRQDFYDTIVLEANLPANKRPASYNIGMQLGHRSGKLTES